MFAFLRYAAQKAVPNSGYRGNSGQRTVFFALDVIRRYETLFERYAWSTLGQTYLKTRRYEYWFVPISGPFLWIVHTRIELTEAACDVMFSLTQRQISIDSVQPGQHPTSLKELRLLSAIQNELPTSQSIFTQRLTRSVKELISLSIGQILDEIPRLKKFGAHADHEINARAVMVLTFFVKLLATLPELFISNLRGDPTALEVRSLPFILNDCLPTLNTTDVRIFPHIRDSRASKRSAYS